MAAKNENATQGQRNAVEPASMQDEWVASPAWAAGECHCFWL